NLTNLLRAMEILNADWGGGIGARRMTVSTSGLAPQILKFAEQPLQIRLAVSLHGASDEVRNQIMPVNRTYNLDRLFESLHAFREHKRQRITLEYILIEGINDDLGQAALLAARAQSIQAKVNLIPYNTVDGLPWKRPSESRQQAFLQQLRRADVPATLRREKGHDIEAACGQLRLREEQALAEA
ncbi:MAG: 23S rRNA (adenine(2503)-C(2))-methyltransferase RlmN, partial [Verrucomicrobiota bacterium]